VIYYLFIVKKVKNPLNSILSFFTVLHQFKFVNLPLLWVFPDSHIYSNTMDQLEQ